MEYSQDTQYVGVVSDKERTLLLRILKAKDAILKLTPGFEEEAEKFRSELFPHDPEVHELVDESLLDDLEDAPGEHQHNMQLAKTFAEKWRLPWDPSPNRDPAYLAECPFSGAPMIEGTEMAVLEWGTEELPLLELSIDIRFPKTVLLQRIGDRISKAREVWESRHGQTYRRVESEACNLENMLRVRELRDRGMTQEKVAEEMEIDPRHVQRLDKNLREILDKRDVSKIAPYTLPSWRKESTLAHELRIAELQKGDRPIRVTPVT